MFEERSILKLHNLKEVIIFLGDYKIKNNKNNKLYDLLFFIDLYEKFLYILEKNNKILKKIEPTNEYILNDKKIDKEYILCFDKDIYFNNKIVNNFFDNYSILYKNDLKNMNDYENKKKYLLGL